MRYAKPPFVLVAVLGLAACGTARPTAELPPEPVAPAAPDDAGIEEPSDGFWERTGPGAWLFDPGTGFPAQIQLGAQPGGRGLLRVTLPAGAARATVTALAVGYARNATDDGSVDESASGEATWTFYADRDDAPGEELGRIDVKVEAAQAHPLEDGGEPVTHGVPNVVVGPTFWLGFSVRSGEPRVGAMLANVDPDGVQFADLFYQAAAGQPLGAPVNARPYVALTFAALGR